jgi:serine protease Do
MQPLTPALAKAVGLSKDEGVLVNEVLPDSPAAKAKLAQGDVILAFDGTPVKTPRDLALAVANVHAGSAVKMTLWRDGHERTTDVTIASAAKAQHEAKADLGEGGPLGLALAPLTSDARAELGLSPATKGVVVAKVTEGSPAEDSGMQPGDVIVRIGDQQVASPKEAASRLQEAEQAKKTAVPLLVTRNGTTYYIALQLAQG